MLAYLLLYVGLMLGIPLPRIRGRSQRGVTLFEAKLGAVAIALTLTGVVFATSKAGSDERARTSGEAASKILKAAEAFSDEQTDGCPTISSLKRDGLLDRAAPIGDAWGGRFRVLCEGQQLRVHSPGPDGISQNQDDVLVESHRG